MAGCTAVIAPRLPDDVAAALRTHPMRRIETDDMIVYYPEGRRELALRFLDRVEGCAGYEKRLALLHGRVADDRLTVILPEVPYNNAFSAPRLAGFEAVTVVPTYSTIDLFTLEGGFPPDPPVIGCHEITHAVHAQQIGGFARFWNVIFGAAYTPQIGLDSWFHEGLAVYYETKLQPGIGRLSWPYWHGVFIAGVAGHRINGGDLSAFNRDFFSGNQYVVGSQFISFLAGRYGEQKLWELIAVEGRSIFFPLWVNLRFWQVYDKTLSTLIDEFADDVAVRNPPAARPPGQRVLRQVGAMARYARAGDGTEAFITEDRDRPSRLIVVGPDGRTRVERNLTDVLPPRRLQLSSVRTSGALSFTADGRSLYFVSLDLDATYQATRLVRYDVAADDLTIVNRDVQGTGGSITPDGVKYLYPRADGDHHDLAELDVKSGAVRVVAALPPGSYVAAPRVSPDGRRVVATVYDGRTFQIVVFDARTGARLTTVPGTGMSVHEAAWADDHRIVYVGTSADDWRFQVFLHDLSGGGTVKVTAVPYLAYGPQVAGGRAVRFLNREGGGWTLDEVTLPPVVAPAVAPSAPPPADVASAAGAPAAMSVADGAVPAALAAEPSSPAEVAAPMPAAAARTAPLAAATRVASSGPLPPPVSAGPPPPEVLATDRPASAIDGLFVPKLYGPTLASVGRQGLLVGATLAGNDALYKHRWGITGYYQFESRLPSVSVGYLNRQLAPFSVELLAAQLTIHDAPPQLLGMPAPTTLSLYRRERRALLDVQRSFYGNPLGLGFALDESYRPGDLAVASYPLQRFAGPFAFATYRGAESTPYEGIRRFASGSVYGAGFPAAWTSAPNGFADLRASASVTLPLPLSRRHDVSLGVRARTLAGLPDGDPLLKVGGLPTGTLWEHSNRYETSVALPPLSPSQMSFVEGLRGFEDHPFATNRIFIADATYFYPFIIDWGSASTAALLPSFFFEEIDLHLFATGATSGADGDRHLAAGGRLAARFDLWLIALKLEYQLARRLTDDRGFVQLVMLSAG